MNVDIGAHVLMYGFICPANNDRDSSNPYQQNSSLDSNNTLKMNAYFKSPIEGQTFLF